MKSKMQKVPFGALAGVCGVFVFYLTFAMIACFQVLDRIEAETNNRASLFGNWWQTLIFVLDMVFICAMAACIVFGVLKRKSATAEIETKSEDGGMTDESVVEIVE